MRESFEKRFPVPPGVVFNENSPNGYMSTGEGSTTGLAIYLLRWETWKAASEVLSARKGVIAAIGDDADVDLLASKPTPMEAPIDSAERMYYATCHAVSILNSSTPISMTDVGITLRHTIRTALSDAVNQLEAGGCSDVENSLRQIKQELRQNTFIGGVN